MVVESPQSFIVAEDCRKAAWQNGYRRDLGQENGWARFASTTAKGTICLAAEGGAGPWFLALDHAGVAAELGLPTTNIACPGLARYVFVRLRDLYDALQRVYALGVSLPDGPLATFGERTRSLPRSTEAERLVVQRIGQDIFRDSLLAYWNGRCPLTGIADPALLRASHIKPWRACDSDAERLDVHNGLLLSALWDAAFDGGLVTFEDDGTPRYSQTLCREARPMLLCRAPLSLTDRHRSYLAWHRTCSFASKPVAGAPMQAP
jgi:hypothetical protein